MKKRFILAAALLFWLAASTKNFISNAFAQDHKHSSSSMPQDKHSYADPQTARVKHLDLNLEVDFSKKILIGKAQYQIEAKGETIILDTRNLHIEKVLVDGKKTTFSWGKEDKILGTALHIPITSASKAIEIHYQTKPDAAALQWLEPALTSGKKHPFLFTQSQAILARTWLPCQDSPNIRMTYSAQVKVPKELMAVMSATNEVKKSPIGIYNFEMKQPIPAYLMALAVADLEFKSLGENTGVYAEPSMLAKASYEFADVQKMMTAAEKLYGKYRWERYDLLLLPASFPFGGMENPRLTFATPTILAGDRSLVSLVAHELAHSWSGNLVTNSTWEDFWLNEGFTVYFELRIMEEVAGKNYADMLALINYQDLIATIEEFKDNPKDTYLKLELEGRDPDDGLNAIAYDKGYFFLRLIEETVGREKFDIFLKNYFNHFAFKTISTEEFVSYLKHNLLDKNEGVADKIQFEKWIYGEGLPQNCPKVSSKHFELAIIAAEEWKNGNTNINTQDWTYQQWVFFLRKLSENITQNDMKTLDTKFHFSASGNNEIAFEWFMMTAQTQYEPAYPAMETFLLSVGRRKFVAPIYRMLTQNSNGTKVAHNIYKKARPTYHPVTTTTLDAMLMTK